MGSDLKAPIYIPRWHLWCRGRLAKSVDPQQILTEIQRDFGIQPTLGLFNSMLAMGIVRKAPTAQSLAVLKDMQVRSS